MVWAYGFSLGQNRGLRTGFQIGSVQALLPGSVLPPSVVWPGVAQGVPFCQPCDFQDAATIFYPYYPNFGRGVWSLQQKGASGVTLQKECAVLIAKWLLRGLSLSVLEAIRSDVFNVSAPVGP